MTGEPDSQTCPHLATRLLDRYRALEPLGPRVPASQRELPLIVETGPSPAWFSATRAHGARLFIDDAEGLCLYAGIGVDTYYLLGAALGLAQWRALAFNPLLIEEDLRHEMPSRCVLAAQHEKCDYALVLEDAFVCSGCIEFYRCLGAEREIRVVKGLLRAIRKEQGARV